MTRRPDRIVDAHVHLWDPARTDWYPYLSSGVDVGVGDATGMARRFDVTTYLAESANWNVEKIVNVAAATGVHSIEETLELDRRAARDGHPDAIVGGVVATEAPGEAVVQIERQMSAAAPAASDRWGAPRTRSPIPRFWRRWRRVASCSS